MNKAKRLLSLGLILLILISTPAFATTAEEVETALDTTLLAQMLEMARDGSEAALEEGLQLQAAWNQKVAEDAEINLQAANFFGNYEAQLTLLVSLTNYVVAAGVTEIDGAPLQYRIVASSKNLRVGPGRDYDRIHAFPHGTIVTYLGSVADGWVAITDGTYSGWGSTMHLAPYDGTRVTEISIPGTVIVNDDGQVTVSGGVSTNVAPSTPIDHTQDELFWLALTIEMEAGSNWLSDEHQLLVGTVVMNRVAHYRFPNTIHGVIHQPGQYAFIASGARRPISDRAWANAERLLNGERFAPENVVFQAEFRQGSGVHVSIRCDVLNNTTYFSYL